MSVILTSFREGDKILKAFPDTIPYSVSRFQPKGYFHPELQILGAYDEFGQRLYLRGRDEPLLSYKEDFLGYLTKNEDMVLKWLESLDNEQNIMLCCWCPHSQSTRNQMKNHLTFACHTGIIGQVINNLRPDIQVWMDNDRDLHLVPEWKPNRYRTIDI